MICSKPTVSHTITVRDRGQCGIFLGALLLAALLLGGGAVCAREFRFGADTFGFSNDTVFAYGVDERGKLHISRREKPPEFSHRCFVLSRATLQFYKFAEFAPRKSKVSREEYVEIVRRISRIPVWSPGPRAKVIVPGYKDLYQFSKAYEGLMKENLGGWLPTYLRVGNWRMTMGHLRAGQAAAARWLDKSMEAKVPRAIYIARFPHMNHVLIAYEKRTLRDGRTRYAVYDPNYPEEPSWVDYVPTERSFNFQKRWYFPGGRVNLMRVYISPFH